MKFRITPGEWGYCDYSPKYNGTYPLYEVVTGNGDYIAEVVHDEHDARAITAVPKMLALLVEDRDMMNALDDRSLSVEERVVMFLKNVEALDNQAAKIDALLKELGGEE